MITTQRLVLRPWNTHDDTEAQSLFHYANDPEVGPRAGWPAHGSVQESRDTITNVLSDDGTFAIVLRNDTDNATTAGDSNDTGTVSSPIGSISLKPMEDDIIATINSDDALRAQYGNDLLGARAIGYWIGKPFWGQGLTSEALTALLDYAFNDLQVPAVWGQHYDSNIGSRRVMEHCGMHTVCSGIDCDYPLIGKRYPSTIQMITRREWQAR